jgi:molybdopterin-guanine dinucleotide biosynthesis protein A
MGRDKAFVGYLGRPLIAHVIERLRPQAEGLAISANGDPERFSTFGCPVLPDARADRPGPLAGIAAGLTWAQAEGFEAVLTAPCDAPFVPGDLGARLIAAGVPAMAEGPDGVEPLFALWPVAARAEVEEALERGEGAVHRLLARLGARSVPIPTSMPGWWLNLNDEPELRAAESAQLTGNVGS